MKFVLPYRCTLRSNLQPTTGALLHGFGKPCSSAKGCIISVIGKESRMAPGGSPGARTGLGHLGANLFPQGERRFTFLGCFLGQTFPGLGGDLGPCQAPVPSEGFLRSDKLLSYSPIRPRAAQLPDVRGVTSYSNFCRPSFPGLVPSRMGSLAVPRGQPLPNLTLCGARGAAGLVTRKPARVGNLLTQKSKLSSTVWTKPAVRRCGAPRLRDSIPNSLSLCGLTAVPGAIRLRQTAAGLLRVYRTPLLPLCVLRKVCARKDGTENGI